MTEHDAPPERDDLVVAEYGLTRREFTWAVRQLQEVAHGRPPWSGWPWGVAALALALVVGLLNPESWPPRVLLGLGVLVLVLIAAQVWLLPWFAYRGIPADRREQRLEVSDDGIVVIAPTLRLEHPWSAVRKVVHGPEVSLLVTHEKGEAVTIARRAFGTAELATLDRLVARHAPDVATVDRRR